jgi:hypothetical protein
MAFRHGISTCRIVIRFVKRQVLRLFGRRFGTFNNDSFEQCFQEFRIVDIGQEPTRGNRRIAMVCAMEDASPGMVPWMIVRMHDYAYDLSGHRLHWQKGMFLWNTRHGEAMLELLEREFHICAQAAWPEFFMNVLRKTLQKLVSDNWPGMEGRHYFAVPQSRGWQSVQRTFSD